jgi:hypothetical protein
LGSYAGSTSQQGGAIAIGWQAGLSTQQSTAIAIGWQAGSTSQQLGGVAIGFQAGQTRQQTTAIAMGYQAGQSSQQSDAISIGNQAGQISQQSFAVAIGGLAGQSSQQASAIAIGTFAGQINQSTNAIAIGNQAGNTNQRDSAIAIGNLAGYNNQNSSTIAIGNQAASTSQSINAIAIGTQAGRQNQDQNAIAIGSFAGVISQSTNAIAIGNQAGQYSQGASSIAIGAGAGQNNSLAATFSNGIGTASNYIISLPNTYTFSAGGPLCIGFWFKLSELPTAAASVTLFSASLQNSPFTFQIRVSVAYVSPGITQFFIITSQSIQYTNNTSININTWYYITIRTLTGEQSFFLNGTVLATAITSPTYSTGGSILCFGAACFNGGVLPTDIGNGINGQIVDFRLYNTILSNANISSLVNIRGNTINPDGVTTPVLWYPFNSSIAGIGSNNIVLSTIGSVPYTASYLYSTNSGTISIGPQTGNIQQGQNAIAIGNQAGQNIQGQSSIAIGFQAGQTSQQTNTIAIGFQAGQNSQSTGAIAIGQLAGDTNQGANTVAIGSQAASTNQSTNAIAIGNLAGQLNQGQNAIAIGNLAGQSNQSTNTIVLNATGAILSTVVSSSLYIAPIRNTVGSNIVLSYNSTTYEVGWTTVTSGGGGGSGTALSTGTAYSNYIFWNQSGTPGWRTETGNTVHIGSYAGSTSQSGFAIAIGNAAGNTNQQDYAVAIGNFAGASTQGLLATAVGPAAGEFTQQPYATALGHNAGQRTQGNSAVAIGYNAGQNNQQTNAIAIGAEAGLGTNGSATTYQGNSAIAIGYQAGNQGQRASSIAIGYQAAQTNQLAWATAIGTSAGKNTQQQYATAVGAFAGENTQGDSAVAIGREAGRSNQLNNAIAMGYQAGNTSQGANTLAIGVNAGSNIQDAGGLAVGYFAASTGQRNDAIAIGAQTARFNQSTNAIAIGTSAGNISQNLYAIAIGTQAGQTTQREYSVAIGFNAGQNSQGASSIAIGVQAGQSTQREYAVAMGFQAGQSSQTTGSIAIGLQAGQVSQGSGIGFATPVINYDASQLPLGTITSWANQGSLSNYGFINGTGGTVIQGAYTREISLPATARFSTNATGSAGTGITYPTFTAAFVYRVSSAAFFLEHGILYDNPLGSYYANGSPYSDYPAGPLYYINVNKPSGIQAFGLAFNISPGGGDAVPYGYRTSGNDYVIQIASISSTSAIFQWYVSSSGITTTKAGVPQNGGWSGFTVPTSSNLSLNMNHRGSTQQFITNILFYNQTFSQIEINNLQTFLQRKYFGITSLGPSIAIGSQAGQISQGPNAIAIGNMAGQTYQPTNSIVLNASGTSLIPSVSSALYIAPIRNAPPVPNILAYNLDTFEVDYTHISTYLTTTTSTSLLTPTQGGTISTTISTGLGYTAGSLVNLTSYTYIVDAKNSGTIQFSRDSVVDVFIIGGGGGGGGTYGGGGGGAGAYTYSPGVSVSNGTSWTLSPGAAGAAGINNVGGNGGATTISIGGSPLFSVAGGGGGGTISIAGSNGGCGGGGGGGGTNAGSATGPGTGFSGGYGVGYPHYTGGGGGGIGGTGTPAAAYFGGKGGNGSTISMLGYSVVVGGGGGGGAIGSFSPYTGYNAGAGGGTTNLIVGGTGGTPPPATQTAVTGSPGAPYTGSGGGGGSGWSCNGGAGASGRCIIAIGSNFLNTSPISVVSGSISIQSTLNTFQGYVRSYNNLSGEIVINTLSNVTGVLSTRMPYIINQGGLSITTSEWAFSVYLNSSSAFLYFFMVDNIVYALRSSPNGYYADYNATQYYVTPNCDVGGGLGNAWGGSFINVVIPFTGMYSFQILCAPINAGRVYICLYVLIDNVQQGNPIEIVDYNAAAGGSNQMCWAQTLKFTAGDVVKISGNTPAGQPTTFPAITFSGSLVYRTA